MEEIGHWINGKRVAGTSGRVSDVYNPATGEVQARVALASPAEIDAAVADAAKAQLDWQKVNPQRRARVMMKFGELIKRDMDKLAELLTREHGKTLPDARGDVQRGLEVIEVCMGAPHILKGEFTDDAGPGIDLYSMRQPLGVVAGITPFNFPAMIPLWKMGPALSSGNAMILKPSERCPSTSLRLAELLQEAGLPDGVLQVINGDKEAVDTILDNETVQAVGFVGSTPMAQYIYGRPANNGKRAHCFRLAQNHSRGAGGRKDRRRADRAADPADRKAEGRPLYRRRGCRFRPGHHRPGQGADRRSGRNRRQAGRQAGGRRARLLAAGL